MFVQYVVHMILLSSKAPTWESYESSNNIVTSSWQQLVHNEIQTLFSCNTTVKNNQWTDVFFSVKIGGVKRCRSKK